MPVTINADSVTGAAVVTADASGVLALQAAGNTGLTLNSSRAIGVGASPSFGTSGQVLTSAGSGAAPAWATPASGSEIIRVARTSNTALTAANKGNLIAITSGTFTQTFDACSSLGNGWFAYIQNSGTGDITLDPSGSETIDGLTSYIMYPGEVRLVQCDGTALRSVVLNAFYRTFTASGTFTKPPGYSVFSGLAWGGGGSGGKGTNGPASGGGGGACVPFVLQASAVGATATVTIASGGAARTAINGAGSAGGNTTFGSIITSFGGGAGLGTNSVTSNAGAGGGGVLGAGGNGATSNVQGGAPAIAFPSVTNPGFGGGNCFSNDAGGSSVYGGGAGGAGDGNISGYAGGASLYGGGGGGGCGVVIGVGSGGTSVYGGAGGAAVTASNGVSGTAPGGGGGGTITGSASGAGARGELRIWGVI